MRVATILSLMALVAVGCKSEKPLPEPVIDSLDVVEDNFELSYEAQVITLNFATNAEYSFELGAEWITLAESRSDVNYEVCFAVAENTSRDERSSYIKVLAGDAEAIIPVIQRGAPERMTLKLTHTNATLATPVWYGNDVSGRVEWGDGSSDSYADDIEHDYSSNGSTAHETLFDMRGAEGFHIPAVRDISDIEIAVELIQ